MSGSTQQQPAVFLDRDGTLIEEVHYLRRPEQVRLLKGADQALRSLQQAGFRLVLVTNQSGVGRGFFGLEEVERVHQHLQALLESRGVRLDAIYVAPERPDQPSHGRKPSPRFLLQARDALGLDLGRSYMVGDKEADLLCGWRAGVRASILVRTGYGRRTEAELAPPDKPWTVVNDIAEAAAWILRCEADG